MDGRRKKRIKDEFPHAVSTAYLQKALGYVDPSQITRLKKDGLPCLPDNRFDIPVVLKWIIDRAAGKSHGIYEEKTRAEITKLELEHQKREIELDKMRAESISREDHEAALIERAKYVRGVIDYETSDFSPEIVGTDSLALAMQKIRALSVKILDRLRGKDEKKGKK